MKLTVWPQTCKRNSQDMFRSFLFALLVAAVTVLCLEPPAMAQFARAPSAYPPPQYPQTQYPPQSYPQMQQPQDQPDAAADEQHGVARVSVVQGDVNVKRGDNGQLEAAAINAPLMARDHLQTSPGSRGEIELDYANLIRLGPNTDVGIADLQYHRYQVQLGAGTIIYRVLRDDSSQAEIDTPSIAVRPLAQGEYRISVLDDGTTQITVRSGQAEIDGPRGSERLDAGRTTLVRGDPTDPEFQTTYEIPRDQLDDWSANRDRDLLGSQSYQRVSPDITGADDLDAYGNWVPSQYGQVWTPRAPEPDWSPYSDGQWTWENYYGWTWVDSDPWGWAPYHYGRWFWNTGYGWCWWPGAARERYAWSPALVGFFGWGGSGVGFAGIGWVALAPFETYHRWWRHGFRGGFGMNRYDSGQYWRNANIGRMYRNANFRGGAMGSVYGRFGGIGQRFHAVTRAQVSNATFFRGQVPVSPTSSAFRFSNRRAMVNTRLGAASNRRFFQSPRTRFHGFEREASGPGVPSNGVPLHGVPPNRSGRFAGQGTPPNRTQASHSTGGWQRFGDPSNSARYREGFTSGSEPSGWHSFGQPPERAAPPSNRGSRSGFGAPVMPRYATPSTPRYSEPRFSSPSQSYRAPASPHNSAPHYSAPSHPSHGGNGGSRGGGGGSPRGGGGSSHGGGGGGHASGGHRSR